MKKLSAVLLAGFSLSCLTLLTSCTMVFGSGVLEQRDYYYQNFDEVVVSSAFSVSVTKSSYSSVSVTVDQNVINYLDIHQNGRTLYIGLQAGTSLGGGLELNASVSMPSLVALNVSGASTVSANGFGSNNLATTVSGASSLTLSGVGITQGSFAVSGASSVSTIGNSWVAAVNVNVSGASTLRIPVLTSAAGTVQGASSFRYGDGSPNLTGLTTYYPSTSLP